MNSFFGSFTFWIFVKTTVILLFSGTLLSNANAQKYDIKHLTTADGLPSDFVNDIFQDREGYIWFSTDKGVAKYDGQAFTYWSVDNGLKSNMVYTINQSTSGKIFVGTLDGLYYLENDKAIAVPHFKTSVSDIVFNSKGGAWLECSNSIMYWPQGGKPMLILENLNNGQAQRFMPIGKDTFIYKHNLTDYKKSEVAYLFGAGESLHRILPNKLRSDNYYLLNLARTDKLSIQVENIYFSAYNNQPPLFWNDELWMATDKLVRINQKGTQFFGAEQGFQGEATHLMVDKDNYLWCATFGQGVYFWKNDYLELHPFENADKKGMPPKILGIDFRGSQILVATTNGIWQSQSDGKPPYSQVTPNQSFTYAAADADGRMICGTYSSIFHIDRRKDMIVQAAGISNLISHEGDIVAGTYGDGVCVYDVDQKKKLHGLLIKDGLVDNMIERVLPLPNLMLAAVSYSKGFSLIRGNKVIQNFDKQSGLLSNTVYHVFGERNGNLWVGSDDGITLIRKEGNAFKVAQTWPLKDGKMVRFVFEDANNRLWAVSDKQLMLFENNKWLQVRSFPVFLNEKQYFLRANYNPRSNHLFLGTDKGLIEIDMYKVIPETKVPTAIKPSIIIQERLVERKNLVLPFKDNTLTFRFNNPIFAKELTLKTEIMLIGFDHDFVPLAGNTATYQKLPEGKYQLLARITGPDDVQGEPYLAATFQILPPYWRTWWFYLIEVLLGSLAIAAVVRFYYNRKLKEKQRLIEIQEKIQLERARISRDLHDNVGAQLATIVRNTNWLTDHLDDISIQEQKRLADTHQSANYAITTLRESIWAMSKNKLSVEDFTDRFKNYARRQVASSEGIELQFTDKIEANHIISPEKALHCWRILQEALNNCLKYANASRIRIGFESSTTTLFAANISDNGVGFDTENQSQGNGMNNMQLRAKEMNASINIASTIGRGTEISLLLKLDNS